MTHKRALVAVFSFIICAIAVAQLGPLDPPPGPIADTSPSLEELAQQISDLQVTTNEIAEVPTTFDVFWSSDAQSLDSTEIAPGRVFVRSISISLKPNTDAGGTEGYAVFDGPGFVDGNGVPTSGSVVAAADRTIGGRGGINSGSWRSSSGMDTIALDTVVENGLYVAWSQARNVVVTYRVLD